MRTGLPASKTRVGQIGTSVRWRSPRRNSDTWNYAVRCSHIRCSASRIDFRSQPYTPLVNAGETVRCAEGPALVGPRIDTAPLRALTVAESPLEGRRPTSNSRAHWVVQSVVRATAGQKCPEVPSSYPGARGDHQRTSKRRVSPLRTALRRRSGRRSTDRRHTWVAFRNAILLLSPSGSVVP